MRSRMPFVLTVVACLTAVCAATEPVILNSNCPLAAMPRTTQMKDIKATIAAVGSVATDTQRNLAKVREVCEKARKDGARIAVLPEFHLVALVADKALMNKNGERVPEGPLSRAGGRWMGSETGAS